MELQTLDIITIHTTMNRSGKMSADDKKKKQKTVFKDNQDLVPEGNLPGNREDRSDKMGSTNSEEIRFENADDIYDEY